MLASMLVSMLLAECCAVCVSLTIVHVSTGNQIAESNVQLGPLSSIRIRQQCYFIDSTIRSNQIVHLSSTNINYNPPAEKHHHQSRGGIRFTTTGAGTGTGTVSRIRFDIQPRENAPSAFLSIPMLLDWRHRLCIDSARLECE